MKSKKTGKVFGKKQILISTMAVALGLAVWLNMKYASDTSGFKTTETTSVIGEAQYVGKDADEQENYVETAAKTDYFAQSRSERENTRNDTVDMLKSTVKSAKLSDDEKKAAVERLALIAKRQENESAIETLLKAKGFSESVAVIGDEGITVVVKSEKLSQTQTLQIQDVIVSQTGEKLEKIKIIAVK